MKKYAKKYLLIIPLFAIIFSLFHITTFADMGPKPSVNVSFKNTIEKEFYVTLLSKTEGSGPWYIPEGATSDYIESEYFIDKDVWTALSSFKDPDGFYLLPFVSKCSDNFKWGYYPPSTFKVLIYFPETDSLTVSKIYERYAFDSYYEIDLKTMTKIKEATTESERNVYFIDCEIVNNYDYKSEWKAFLARILVTLLIEILIAFVFGILNKKSFFVLLVVNILTQAFLNTALNIRSYYNGEGLNYYRSFMLYEVGIFIFEAICYALILPRYIAKGGKRRAVIYAIIANATSLFAGLGFSIFLDSIF